MVPHTNEHQTINQSIDLSRTRSLFNVNSDIFRGFDVVRERSPRNVPLLTLIRYVDDDTTYDNVEVHTINVIPGHLAGFYVVQGGYQRYYEYFAGFHLVRDDFQR